MRPFLRSWIPIWLGIGVLAIGIKFPIFWNRTVYFPAIPNVLDTIFLVIAGIFLLRIGLKRLLETHPPVFYPWIVYPLIIGSVMIRVAATIGGR